MTQCLQRQHAVYDVNLQGAKHELRLHWLLVAVTHKQDQALHPYSAAASAPDCIASRVKAGPRRLDAWQREGPDRGREGEGVDKVQPGCQVYKCCCC